MQPPGPYTRLLALQLTPGSLVSWQNLSALTHRTAPSGLLGRSVTLASTFTVLVKDRLFQGTWSGGGFSGYFTHATMTTFQRLWTP